MAKMVRPDNERNHLRGAGAPIADEHQFVGVEAAGPHGERNAVRQRNQRGLRRSVFISISVLFAWMAGVLSARALHHADDLGVPSDGADASLLPAAHPGTLSAGPAFRAPSRFDIDQGASPDANPSLEEFARHDTGSNPLPSAGGAETASPLLLLERAYAIARQAEAPIDHQARIGSSTVQSPSFGAFASRTNVPFAAQPPAGTPDGDEPPANDTPPTITSGAAAAVTENTAPSTVIYDADAADPDTVGSISFSISGPDAGRFAIDADDGELRFLSAPDSESPADTGADNVYDIVLHANDGVSDTTRAITITVTDTNDVAPAITSGAAVAVVENTAPLAVVYDANAVDPDTMGTVVFSLGGADATLFVIDADDGEVRFLSSPDFEAAADAGGNHVYDIVIHANDGVFDTMLAVAITVGDTNDVAPTITSGGAATLAEDTASSTVIHDADAIDPDTVGSITFSITGGDAALFAIDANDGELRFVSVPDFEAPGDVGGNNVYDIVIRANDGASDSTQAVTITVSDVNDVAPAITSGSAAVVTENIAPATVVYTISAADPDTVGTVSFTISGADAGFFAIDSDDGELRFASSPDFEAAADAGGNNVYDIVVHANDGVFDSTQSVAITVGDANDVVPTITSGAAATVGENTAPSMVIYDANANDPDTIGAIVFSITGADAALFAIDADDGELRFLSSPNFESPADVGGNNVYDIVIHANDGQFDSTLALAITVGDANDVAPTITSGSVATVTENTAASNVIYDANASDPDTVGTVVFSLSGADAALFAIDTDDGGLRFVSPPDFETPADAGGNNVYNIVIHANDGASDSTQAVTITVGDSNDVAPTITSGSASAAAENMAPSTIVYDANATDPDSVGTIVFSITGADAALFGIDADDGELRFLSSPDFELPADAGVNNVYDIVVHANDGVFDSTQSVAITVGDANDVVPTITSGAAATVGENTTPSTVIYDANANDPDTIGAIVFSITGADAALFAIDADDGELRFLSSPNFESPADVGGNNVYDIVIHANDGVFDTTKAVTITVGDVNDIAPTITSGNTAALTENTATATVVYDANAADPDTVGTIVFSLTGADAGVFVIDADDGELRFLGSPDFESPADAGANNVYDIIVHANDGLADATKAVTITVGDVNDIAPTITSGSAVAVMENTAPSTVVYDANATDPDTVGTIVFSITGTDAARFTIDANDGELRFVGAPDFEAPADAGANNVYDIVVRANDGVSTTTQAVTITVGNAVEDPNDNNNDSLGLPSNDTITGTGSGNTLYGGAGDDVISAGGGNDRIYGGTGRDTIDGGAGRDRIYGGWGNDTISAGDADDTVYGGSGDDTVNGQNGNDTVYGGIGNDLLNGDANNDTIYGEAGNDTINGGTGTDILVGGDGSDILNGNAGADTFRYLSLSNGGDTITGFSRAQSDKIDVAAIDSGNGTSGAFAWGGTTPTAYGVWYQQIGGDTVLSFDTNGNTGTAEMVITLTGTGLGLTASDFIL